MSVSPSPRSTSKTPSRDRSPDHALTAIALWRTAAGPRRDRPLFLSEVPAGFPSPAEDYVEATLDLSEHLIQNEEATFFVRVAGHSMREAGIHDGDLLVVNRAAEPDGGDVVVAALDGELTVKRYCLRDGQPYLVPEAKRHDPIAIQPGQDLVVWGVVQHVIHEVS